MKNIFLISHILGLFFLTACSDNDAKPTRYSLVILSPDTSNKFVGDSIHIHVDFTDNTDDVVHHANVRIYNKATGQELFSGPADDHVNQSLNFSFHDDLWLDSNKVEAHSDWVLVGKVWAETSGVDEVKDSIEFHVHPK